MKRAKYVELCDGVNHKLEQIRERVFKLKEVEGKITSCESDPYLRNSLVMRLEGCNKDLTWDEVANNTSLPAIVGQTLRGFYEGDERIISLKAYEISIPGEEVLRRGRTSVYLKFVD